MIVLFMFFYFFYEGHLDIAIKFHFPLCSKHFKFYSVEHNHHVNHLHTHKSILLLLSLITMNEISNKTYTSSAVRKEGMR